MKHIPSIYLSTLSYLAIQYIFIYHLYISSFPSKSMQLVAHCKENDPLPLLYDVSTAKAFIMYKNCLDSFSLLRVTLKIPVIIWSYCNEPLSHHIYLWRCVCNGRCTSNWACVYVGNFVCQHCLIVSHCPTVAVASPILLWHPQRCHDSFNIATVALTWPWHSTVGTAATMHCCRGTDCTIPRSM